MKRKIASLLGLSTAAGLLMVGAGAGQANAASANISSWTSSSRCNLSSIYEFCLYYHQNDGGGMWGSTSTAVSTITASFPAGEGAVRNNAASAENGTVCNVGIWVSPGYVGNSDWLSPNMGGNLGPALRNNEASIALDDHANCPGIGIG
jgi:hypothetical protein